MIVYILQFLMGSVCLYFGAEFFIQASKKIATKFNISSIIIGITLIAFGTSLPELIVSILANVQGKSGLVMGNIMGSNVANIGLVLGITAVFYPIHFSFVKIRYDLYFLIGITLLLLKFISMGNLELWQGVLFLLLLFSYCIYLLRANQFTNEDNKILIMEKNYFLWIKIVLGMIGLAFGSSIFITGATGIAKTLGIPPLIIGMSIVALGTSLPELTTSLAAARHGETDFIIGNIIGSNIMNIIAVLGISILFRPIHTNFSDVAIQGLFMAIFVLSLFFLLKWKNGITKLSGIILMIIYALFLYFNFHGI